MQYINPLEILQLSNLTDVNQIDAETIKKAKRKLVADIELSDYGNYNYHGIQLSKGECEQAIDELANNERKEFYLYLTTNKKLNEFLVNGNNSVFKSFKQDSIFKLPDFINFISPYYAPKFDSALLSAFEDEDIVLLESILKTSFLIPHNQLNIAYRGVTNTLQNRLSEFYEIRTQIKNEESTYDDTDVHELVCKVKEYFPTKPLNCLPSYFQSQILKIANEINNLNVAIWDYFDNTQVSQDILEHILTLNIDGLNKPIFENNYRIVKNKNKQRKEEEKNAPILRKYAIYLILAKDKIKELEIKTLTPHSLKDWVNSSLSIPDLNLLPESFDEIRNQVALSLRAMSVCVWNSYSNVYVSMDLINLANSITRLKSETSELILEAKNHLADINQKIFVDNIYREVKKRKPIPAGNYVEKTKSSISDNGSGCVWIVVVLLVIGIVMIISKNKKSSSSNNNPDNNSYSFDNNYPTTPTEDYSTPEEKVSEYKGNQLSDGASPLDGCFGRGIYSGNATLKIENGGSSDAIICLFSISSGRTIRNEYVRKNSSFTMTNIAQGNYKIRVFYGNDWNPTLTNSCGTKGNFETDAHFSEFDGTQYFEDSERGYTNSTITLYAVPGGNASSSAIDESTFFKNQ